MSAPTTDELLVAAGHGDRSAFAHLYDRSAGDVYAVVRHLVPGPVAAERVVTDIWLEVWRTAGRFDPSNATAIGWVLARAYAAIGLRDAGHEALEPVELCSAGRFTYRDVAELFGEQPGAIAVRIRDGLLRLRDGAGVIEADGAR